MFNEIIVSAPYLSDEYTCRKFELNLSCVYFTLQSLQIIGTALTDTVKSFLFVGCRKCHGLWGCIFVGSKFYYVNI